MSEPMPEPTLYLETKDDLRQALANPVWQDGPTKYLVKSKWLIDLIDHFERTVGFPFNACICKAAEIQPGYLPRSEAEYAQENTPLSTLIYNAQRFRRSDKLRAHG